MLFKLLKVFVCVLCCFVINSNAGVVSFITPCHLNDQTCLLSSSQAVLPKLAAGLPDLGVPSLNPLVLENVKSDQGGLNLEFRNMRVNRLVECKMDKMAFTDDVSNLKFDVECPITASGQYTVSGKLLFAPIEGDGDFEIGTENVKISVDVNIKTIEKDGKKYLDITSYDYSFELVEKFTFRFDNLFGGDQEKASSILAILNEKYKEVITTIGKPIIDEMVLETKEIIQKFFHVVPTDELYLQ